MVEPRLKIPVSRSPVCDQSLETLDMERIQPKEKLAYTVAEAGAMLSLSRSSMYELINAGKIETIRIGRSRRITKRQLEHFVVQLTGERL